MKKAGIVFIVLAFLNLITAFVGMGSGAPSDTVSMKFNGFIMLSVLGGLLLYFGNKKQTEEKNQNKSQGFHLNKENRKSETDTVLGYLKIACNPGQFVTPYNKELLEKANSLYPRILNCSPSDINQIKDLRIEAKKLLGIQVPTDKLYNFLVKECNPSKFSDPQNYDSRKVSLANSLYERIIMSRDNYDELEQLFDEGKMLGIIESANSQYRKFIVGQLVVNLASEEQLKITSVNSDGTYSFEKNGYDYPGHFDDSQIMDFNEYWNKKNRNRTYIN